MKVVLLTKDQCMHLHNVKNSTKQEYVISCFLNIPLEFTPGNWSLDAKRTLTEDNFEDSWEC